MRSRDTFAASSRRCALGLSPKISERLFKRTDNAFVRRHGETSVAACDRAKKLVVVHDKLAKRRAADAVLGTVLVGPGQKIVAKRHGRDIYRLLPLPSTVFLPAALPPLHAGLFPPMNPLMKKRLDAALTHFRLKDQTAAKRAKLDKDFIRNMRRGKSASPRTENFRKLAESFQASTDWLSGLPEAEPPVWARSDDPEAVEQPAEFSKVADTADRNMRVAELDVRGSMGPGLQVEADSVSGEWQFPREFLRQATRSPADRLRIITVVGDSLEPVFRSMERVLVDTQDQTPSPAGFFVVWDGLGQVVKRVEYVAHSNPPRVRISSVNPAYEPYERTLDEAYIQGRVLGKWSWV